jgi:hypothetical protein
MFEAACCSDRLEIRAGLHQCQSKPLPCSHGAIFIAMSRQRHAATLCLSHEAAQSRIRQPPLLKECRCDSFDLGMSLKRVQKVADDIAELNWTHTEFYQRYSIKLAAGEDIPYVKTSGDRHLIRRAGMFRDRVASHVRATADQLR